MRFLIIIMIKLRFVFFLILITLFISCKKKDADSILGLDVQPEEDLVGVQITDTISLQMFTQKIDSIKSYNDQYKYLGSNLDPVFGRTDVGIYTNFSIVNNLTNLTFGSNPILDSAEIVIRFLGQSIGDTATTLNYDVYQLDEKLINGKSYYSSNQLTLGKKVSSISGKIKNRGSNLCLIFPLDEIFANEILKTNANLVNNTSFQNAYKGLYITTSNSSLLSPGSGAIRRFDLDDDISGINIYYHDGNSLPVTAQSAQFSFRGIDAVRFNNIKHDYTMADLNLKDQLNSTESIAISKGTSNIYVNCFGGTRAKIYLPHLKNFTDSQLVSINRAELIIKIDETKNPYNPNYTYPSNLALIACGADGSEELVYDQLETTDFVKYGGNYDAINKQYVFNIARQVQKILTNNISNYGFYLVNAIPNKSYVIRRDNQYSRVIFGGKNNVQHKALFKITYIKYPKNK